ncbi:MAG: hypothetical protein Q8Q01_02590 [archaeon]|nr:hypothetical protein [archaeon]
MTFLEDLMELEEPVNQGIKLPFSRQSFLSRLLRNDEATNYFLHWSNGGLPLVLPHDDEGELYHPRVQWGASPQKKGSLEVPHEFDLIDCLALVRDEQRFKAEKVIGRDYPVKMSYAITLMRGRITHVELSYKFDMQRDGNFKEGASFTVSYPSRSNNAQAEPNKRDPQITVSGGGRCVYSGKGEVSFHARKDGTLAFRLPDGLSEPKQVDYDLSMQSLVGFMLRRDFNLSDLFHLRYLDYFVFK